MGSGLCYHFANPVSVIRVYRDSVLSDHRHLIGVQPGDGGHRLMRARGAGFQPKLDLGPLLLRALPCIMRFHLRADIGAGDQALVEQGGSDPPRAGQIRAQGQEAGDFGHDWPSVAA